MANFPISWTDKQWFAFICGFRAGLTVADANAPYIRLDTVLNPLGLGGPNERAIMIGNSEYTGDGEYRIPVYTYKMTYARPMKDFSGFTARIDISDSRLGFIGIEAGAFDPTKNLTYQIVQGNILVVQGLAEAQYVERDTGNPVVYSLADLKQYGPLLYSTSAIAPPGISSDMEILFYLHLQVTGGVYSDSPINIPLLYSSGTIDSDVVTDEQTTLITFLKGSDVVGSIANPNLYYMYFVTPVQAVGGAILSAIPSKVAPIGPSEPADIKASPTCIYSSTVYTPSNWPAVMGLYVNPNPDDLKGADIQYVTAKFHIKSKADYAITRWTIEAGRGWEMQEQYSTVPDLNYEFDVFVNAKRIHVEGGLYTGMFAYIIATVLFDTPEMLMPVIPTEGAIYYTDGGVDNG